MNDARRKALERLESMEALYESALEKADAAEAGLARIESFLAAMAPLMSAYDETWIDDRETVEELDPPLAVLGEDTVWNLYGREHDLAARLLRLAADHFAPSDEADRRGEGPRSHPEAPSQ